MGTEHDITTLLADWRGGDEDAVNRLMPLVYDELRRIAHRQLRGEAPGHTLGTTALVHEAYLRLVDHSPEEWTDRGHFFALAAWAMRRILVDYARRHGAVKRGGARALLRFDDGMAATVAADERAGALVALDEALDRLSDLDRRLTQVVECRFFAGLTDAETGEALGLTARTVRRDWVKAKGWLHRELRD